MNERRRIWSQAARNPRVSTSDWSSLTLLSLQRTRLSFQNIHQGCGVINSFFLCEGDGPGANAGFLTNRGVDFRSDGKLLLLQLGGLWFECETQAWDDSPDGPRLTLPSNCHWENPMLAKPTAKRPIACASGSFRARNCAAMD